MDPTVEQALSRPQVIDMTTTGRRSGQPRRVEIVFHNHDGRIFISGMPDPARTRAWIRNLEADPHLTIHLKRGINADVSAIARIVTDPAERRAVFERIVAEAWRNQNVETMTAYSPLIEVSVDEAPH